MRIYPLPTALVMCDTSGWGSFKVTYEGCCVINTGALLRVDQGDGRGRYAGAWWEWNCGSREGREVVVGIVDREKEVGKEKKERRKKGGEKSGAGVWERMTTTAGKSKVVEEIIVEEVFGNETQEDNEETREDYYRETQEELGETQMDEDPELDGDMEVDV
jgi:hypothetical protein